MHVPAMGTIERVARVLAGERLSVNAEGDETSAGADVDSSWRDHRDAAIAVLKTLREPDDAMTAAGDAAVWQRMVDAAIGAVATSSGDSKPPELGSDSFTESP